MSVHAKDSFSQLTNSKNMLEHIDKNFEEASNECASNPVSMEHEMTIYPHQLKSDETIAKVMQLQYDKEYDILKYIEKNSSSSQIAEFKEDVLNIDCSEEEFEDLSDEESDQFSTILEGYDSVPLYNFGYNNRRKVSEDNSGIRIKSFDKRLQKQKKPDKQKICEKKENRITVSYGVDDVMRTILYRMMDQQILKEVNDVIFFGKRSVILHITVDPLYQLPSECAIMMFKTVLPEHKNLGRRATRKLMRLAAEKEMQNLEKLRRAGVVCPAVFGLKGPALVISFLGRNKKLSPTLKDVNISETKMCVAYSQVVHYIDVMYKECKLVHGDLSEYNILWFNNDCYIIDVSQCVDTLHENAFLLLYKDCKSISKFFGKRGVPDVATADQLFKDVTGWDYAEINLNIPNPNDSYSYLQANSQK